jgi:hypothetical protein
LTSDDRDNALAVSALMLLVAREKDVEDEEMYGPGFRLLESSEENDKELDAELLQGIIDERPRSKLAKAARNKLKLTGYLDE